MPRRSGAPPREPGRARCARSHDGVHHLLADFLQAPERAALLDWLATLRPLWEKRYSTRRPPPPGRAQRELLRPVYWVGSWQFACLDYYRPPRQVRDRCVRAEPFPEPLRRLTRRIERAVRECTPPEHRPPGHRFTACLVNFYGARVVDGRRVDRGRVGEHRDFEPGPVASLSIGERALFQFVEPGPAGRPVLSQWLDDNSLQIFSGPRYKDELLHRVQRVDRRLGVRLPPAIEGFETRRVNLTFRWVPEEHVVSLADLPREAFRDVEGYAETLAQSSTWFREELERARRRRGEG